MKRKRLLFLFIFTFIIFFSISFRCFRNNEEKKLRTRSIFQNFVHSNFLNKDQPFRFHGDFYVHNQILVKFKPSLSIKTVETTIEAYQAKKLDIIDKINVYQIQIPENMTVDEMVFAFNQNPNVEYAEPNYIFHITKTPNDIYFKEQYSLFNPSREIWWVPGKPFGKQRADIKAPEAWEETIGDNNVIIAVIDTGVDLLHPDIKNKILSEGRDFFNNDFDASDDNGHGSHVAGIAAAETNNTIGIAGVAWNCKILPVKAFDENGDSDSKIVSKAIIWAADQEADVINMSWGGKIRSSFNARGISQTIEDSLKHAFEKNIVLVATAGNEGSDVEYPASSEYTLAVAATNYNDERVTFSNSGGEWESNYGPEVDVAAPGEWVLSLWPINKTPVGYLPYAFSAGTSMSAPHVAGLAALIKSIKPWLDVSDIMNVIRYSADDTNSATYPGKDNFIGYGRINMEKALVPIKITSSK